MNGSLRSGRSNEFHISLKKELEAMQIASVYAIWRAYSTLLRIGFISYILLIVSYGYLIAQAIYFILSKKNKSPSLLDFNEPMY